MAEAHPWTVVLLDVPRREGMAVPGPWRNMISIGHALCLGRDRPVAPDHAQSLHPCRRQGGGEACVGEAPETAAGGVPATVATITAVTAIGVAVQAEAVVNMMGPGGKLEPSKSIFAGRRYEHLYPRSRAKHQCVAKARVYNI